MNTIDRTSSPDLTRSVLYRWAVVLVLLTGAMLYSAWRMTSAATRLPATLVGATVGLEHGAAPVTMQHAGHDHQTTSATKPKLGRYRCTMPECGDQGSNDPNSRCPVCGMKREEREGGTELPVFCLRCFLSALFFVCASFMSRRRLRQKLARRSSRQLF